MFLSNVILPVWVKPVAYAVAAVALVGFGYTKGIEHVYKGQRAATTQLVYKQGKVTTKVVTKYVKVAEKIKSQGEDLKKEGQGYAIKFPSDNYIFNNYYVRLYDSSITGSVPALSGGDTAEPSGVSVSESLSVSLINNVAGRMWKNRALACEEWAEQQEKASVK